MAEQYQLKWLPPVRSLNITHGLSMHASMKCAGDRPLRVNCSIIKVDPTHSSVEMVEAVNIDNMLVRGLLVMLSLSAASESSAKSALYLLLQMPSEREVKRFMKNQDLWENCKAEKLSRTDLHL